MAVPEIIVARVTRLEPPTPSAAPGGVIHFDNGQTARPDPSHPHSAYYVKLLSDLQTMSWPAYVERDAASQTIVRVLMPLVGRVVGIAAEASGDLAVRFEPSCAVHHLRKSNPNFAAVEQNLRGALAEKTRVILTATADQQIVDARPDPAPSGGRGASADVGDNTFPITEGYATIDQTNAAFQTVSDMSCSATVQPVNPPGCIPFLYVANGCWDRAQAMCDALQESNSSLSVNKLWLFGQLSACTVNFPTCRVEFSWHVAVAVQVRDGNSTEWMVIDPAFFDAAVSLETCLSFFSATTATQKVFTNAQAFYPMDTNSGTFYTEQNARYGLGCVNFWLYFLDTALYNLSTIFTDSNNNNQPYGPPPYNHAPYNCSCP